MKEFTEIGEIETSENSKSPEKIKTFGDLQKSDHVERPRTFDNVQGKETKQPIETFDQLASETAFERAGGENIDSLSAVEIASDSNDLGIEGVSEVQTRETVSRSAGELSFEGGRHRTFVAVKEGIEDVPVRLNDIYIGDDGRQIIDRRDVTRVSFDSDVLGSNDMQGLMKEHDFQQWAQGEGLHKGHSYADFVKEYDRLRECQSFIKQGHSTEEISASLGDDHAATYKRFHETSPIKFDRVIDTRKS